MNIISQNHRTYSLRPRDSLKLDFWAPFRKWLNQIQFHHIKLAHFTCQLIPPSCPFERDVRFFGVLLFHIPPLCKLNPLYEELINLRFRALSYLAELNEDISAYIA